MTVEYAKDTATDIVSSNCSGTAELIAAKRPAEDTQEVGAWVAASNHSGRVFIPDTDTPYEVIVRTKGEDYVVASGTTNTPTEGKATPIWVRVRVEPEIVPPSEPIVEEIP